MIQYKNLDSRGAPSTAVLGRWSCPVCEATGTLLQPEGRVTAGVEAALATHLTITTDDAHGERRKYPEGVDSERLDECCEYRRPGDSDDS